MRKYHDENLLEMIEMYAEERGHISSNEELSELFDDSIAPMVVKQYGEDDKVAMNEAFSNWLDGLCKEGEIHPEQYSKYHYVGEYS